MLWRSVERCSGKHAGRGLGDVAPIRGAGFDQLPLVLPPNAAAHTLWAATVSDTMPAACA